MKLRSCERPKTRGGRILDVTDEQRRDATQMRDFTTGVNPFSALGAMKPIVSIGNNAKEVLRTLQDGD